MEWLNTNQVKISPPKKTKKITGTRFATILGLNPWSTPFEMWCAITKTYEKPFEDTIYTLAGKAIEPKQAKYMQRSYGMTIITPTDRYGADYFNKTYGDFFPESKHLGGMWDYLAVGADNNVDTVLEMKTTKRSEDWLNDIPEYYALQAALYAWLLGIDKVVMVASFLEEKDYADPTLFIPNIKNTITVEFRVSERYPDFADKVAYVEKWWSEYVETGISPVYDEKKDAEILKALRTNFIPADTDISALIAEAEGLTIELNEWHKAIEEKEKRLDNLKKAIKNHAVSQFRPGDKKVEIAGGTYKFTVTASVSSTIDKDRLKKDGLLDKYSTPTTTFKLTMAKSKEK